MSDHSALARARHEAAAQFGPEELARLLYAIIEINAWNRLATATGSPEPGSYQPGTQPEVS